MRTLFDLDAKDYKPDWKKKVRPSVRAILIRDGRIAMVHSLKYDYYKFPGGGIEEGETQLDALCRETAEEAGMTVIRDTVTPFGMVHRIEKAGDESIFVQDNFYYLCEAEDAVRPQELDDYESEERFTLEFVLPQTAIAANRAEDHGPKSRLMIEREARVLEMLIGEGYFAEREA